MRNIISLVLVLALGLTTEVANADFTFGEPTNLGATINSSSNDGEASISADGLALYFKSTRPGGYGESDLLVTTRETTDHSWGPPVNLGSTVNSSAFDGQPHIFADGLMLSFVSERSGGYGDKDIWVTTRETKKDPWGTPVNLGPTVNNSSNDNRPYMSADGLSLYFSSDRPGGFGYNDLHVTRRPTVEDEWGLPLNLGPTVNSTAIDLMGCVSVDGLWLFFSSFRSGGFGLGDLYVTTRAARGDEWGLPVNLGQAINSPARDAKPMISADGRTLYFNSDRPAADRVHDIYQASIIPLVDLNGDRIVDAWDMCIMVDHWGENYSFCDIGPMPWGDGIVDVKDLKVLAENLFEEVDDPTLVAHWALDEIEGDIASDSVNDNDGTVYGDPAWQPQGGMVDGALQLDGIDDYVSTPFVLNPTDGKFSIIVWIKGGAPGQAVLSQIGGANWILADASEGNLMTELKATGRGAAAMLSQIVITDGNWHRIGLVWDGSHRTLYVDGVAVAEDEQTNLAASENGLYIGTGNAMESGTFWSGLIDDVRIYNRVVRP